MANRKQFPDGAGIPEETVQVGRIPFELPQRYYDWSFIMAHFPAPTRRVRRLIPCDRLVPVELIPGIAAVTLAAFEYRRMETLEAYNEFAVMVPVRCEPDRNIPLLPMLWPDRYDVGFWVHHLPVTTPQARAVGVAVWGFPKVVADKIAFSDVGWMRRCELWEDGEQVLTFSAMMGETRYQARPFYAFSLLDDELLKTLVDTRGQYHAWYVPGRACFSLGRHPVSEALNDLEVENLAIAGLFAFNAKSRLHRGIVVAESGARPAPLEYIPEAEER
jgi:hypothetical protein